MRVQNSAVMQLIKIINLKHTTDRQTVIDMK
jgi:hypothetical protein